MLKDPTKPNISTTKASHLDVAVELVSASLLEVEGPLEAPSSSAAKTANAAPFFLGASSSNTDLSRGKMELVPIKTRKIQAYLMKYGRIENRASFTRRRTFHKPT